LLLEERFEGFSMTGRVSLRENVRENLIGQVEDIK
jgi:hypothetical protein